MVRLLVVRSVRKSCIIVEMQANRRFQFAWS
jgi:hypothetical protein